MKNWIFVLAILTVSCTNKPSTSSEAKVAESITSSPEEPKQPIKKDKCWGGTLNGNIPVFIHFQWEQSTVVGEIIYLNTKEKRPIKLIGTYAIDQGFYLYEFDKTGNITGVLSVGPDGQKLIGVWNSPDRTKEFSLDLVRKDTVIPSIEIHTDISQVFGKYHYQYGDKGYQGGLELDKREGKNASLAIFSMTNAPARNMAEVSLESFELTDTEIEAKVPDMDNCAYKVKFYKDFAHVQYTQNQCQGYFGRNATIEGIFLKVAEK